MQQDVFKFTRWRGAELLMLQILQILQQVWLTYITLSRLQQQRTIRNTFWKNTLNSHNLFCNNYFPRKVLIKPEEVSLKSARIIVWVWIDRTVWIYSVYTQKNLESAKMSEHVGDGWLISLINVHKEDWHIAVATLLWHLAKRCERRTHENRTKLGVI